MQQVTYGLSNGVLIFKLKNHEENHEELIVRAFFNQQTQKKFEKIFSNQTLPQYLKQNHKSIDVLYFDLKFDYLQQDFSLVKDDSSAKIIIVKQEKVCCQIHLQLLEIKKLNDAPIEVKPFAPKQVIIVGPKKQQPKNIESPPVEIIKQQSNKAQIIEKKEIANISIVNIKTQQNNKIKPSQNKKIINAPSSQLKKKQSSKVQIIEVKKEVAASPAINQCPVIKQSPLIEERMQQIKFQQAVQKSQQISNNIKKQNTQSNKQESISNKVKEQENQQTKRLINQEKQLDQKIRLLKLKLKSRQDTQSANYTRLKNLQEQISKRKLIQVKASQELFQAKKKYVSNPIQNSQQYAKHIQNQNGKKKLFMRQMQVQDDTLQQIVTFDLTKLQVLSLGDNKITDIGFSLLFAKNQWPILSEIFLQNNQIQNINYLHKIDGIQTLVLYDNPLSQASSTFLCQYWWPFIKNIRLSFKQGINVKCWKIIIPNLIQKFPSLEQLYYTKKEDLNQQIMQQILVLCNSKGIRLNHSLNQDLTKQLLTLQLAAKLLEANSSE